MKRLSDNAVIDKCGDCGHCFDNYNGEYDYPFVEPQDYKNPECDNLPMTNDGTFPKVDINTIHPSCLLKEVDIIEVPTNCKRFTYGRYGMTVEYAEYIEKIIIVKKAKESE